MRIKLNGGPEHGKYYDVRDGGYQEFVVQIMDPKVNIYAADLDPYQPLPVKRGSYRPSNTTLKNGVRVWQWMGWYSK